MEKYEIITWIGFIILTFGVLMTISSAIIDEKYPTIDGDCHDKYGHKIKGVVCEIEQVPSYSFESIGMISLLLGFIIIIISLVVNAHIRTR